VTTAVATTGGALALRDDQTSWDERQLATLRAIGIEEDVSQSELDVFLHECQRRKLDPFTRQIYLIGRWDKHKKRKVYRSQTSIDGFRLIARRAANREGIDYSYEDTIWFDERGQRYEIWLNPNRPPAGAKVVVLRNGMRFDAVARFGAYVQTFPDGNPLGQWVSMPDVMIAKCAEALALRKAFPEDLGGLYTEEEMGQADNPDRVEATVEMVNDEPAGQPAQGGGRRRTEQRGTGRGRQQQRPANDPAATENRKWLAEARAAVPGLDEAGLAKVRAEGQARTSDGRLSTEDAKALAELIAARRADLQSAALAATQLPADDSWAEAIDGIGSPQDAEPLRTDIAGQLRAGEVDQVRYQQVIRAINGKVQMIINTQAGAVQGEVIESRAA
jgi:phage recombination protein Bet